tara:strand:+ start:446 stop:640 length:195 start_codon:yes stop_codon:yes gene_type:complete
MLEVAAVVMVVKTKAAVLLRPEAQAVAALEDMQIQTVVVLTEQQVQPTQEEAPAEQMRLAVQAL